MTVLLFSQHRVAAGEHFEHWLTWWNGEGQGRAKPLGGALLAAYEGSAQWTLLTAWADDAPPALRCPCSKARRRCSAPKPCRSTARLWHSGPGKAIGASL